MKISSVSLVVVITSLLSIVIYFVVLPWAYVTSENRNFAAMQRKNELECNVMPLHCLLKAGNEQAIRTYLSAGLPVNGIDGWGQNPLLWAIRNHKLEHVTLLLQAGADPTLLDERGDCALLLVMLSGYFDLADEMLARGAKVDGLVGIGKQKTYLHYCVGNGNADCVRYLLSKDADPNVKDQYGYSVYERIQIDSRISEDIKALFAADRAAVIKRT